MKQQSIDQYFYYLQSHTTLSFSHSLETACGVPIPYWDSTVDHDMADPTMSILWSDMFYGNGDGDVMTGPYQSVRTILGTPLERNIGTGMELLFVYFFCLVFFILLVRMGCYSYPVLKFLM